MRFVSLIATVGIATLTFASLVGCTAATSSEEDPAAEPATDDGEAQEIKAAVIDEGDNNKTIPITLGRSFTIALTDNASTGFQWNVKSVDKTLGQPKITEIPGDPRRPGSAGLKKFTWSTSSPLNLLGRHKIVLEHARSFNKVGATLFTVTIDIQNATPSAPTCGGRAGAKCGLNSYCDFTLKAQCGAADHGGTCVTRPMFCPSVIIPVCGCDGRTHNNSCEANRAGVSIVSAGACPK